jgi:DNA-binding GntR family transcriptional regulator
MGVDAQETPTNVQRSTTRAETLADRIYAEIKEQILTGVIAPGLALRPAELAEAMGVSSTVVREALTRLCADLVVLRESRTGFRVQSPEPKHVIEITDLRVLIETAALERSINLGGIDWETSLIGAHHRMMRTEKSNPDGKFNGAWRDAHRAFHMAIVGGCDNTFLLDVCEQMWDLSNLYRQFAATYSPTGTRDPDKEHDELLAACLDRDLEAATSRLQTHIHRTAIRALEARWNYDFQHGWAGARVRDDEGTDTEGVSAQ